ncbi:hypothetical protein EDB83DRAFT_2524557 [Lactarius deliciosus]|nr:hypothetical protein EDB83DRAFT_2524557 [Lactarius deliciosus]
MSPDAFPAKGVHALTRGAAKLVVQAQLALDATNPNIVALYEHYSDDAKRAQNDAAVNAEWADWFGEVVCDVERLVHLTGPETLDSAGASLFFITEPFPKPHTLTFDHIYPTPGQALSSPQRCTAVPYAPSNLFRQLHSHLLRLSSGPTPRTQYVLRFIPPNGVVKGRGYLSGYGVTPVLKKLSTIDVPVAETSHRKTTPHADDAEADLDSILPLLGHHPSTRPWTSISILATQLVSESPTPLQTLKRLVHDFPKYATSLARRIVPQSGLLEEISSNSCKIRLGVSAVWLYGARVPPGEPVQVMSSLFTVHYIPRSLLSLVHTESGLMISLRSLGLLPGEVFEPVIHPSFVTSSLRGDATDRVFDSSDRAEGGNLIFWWNERRIAAIPIPSSRSVNTPIRLNITLDTSTATSAKLDIFKPGHFGNRPQSRTAERRSQAPSARCNMFSVVFVFDLSRPASLHFITNTVSMLIDRSYPIHLGNVPIVDRGGRKDG